MDRFSKSSKQQQFLEGRDLGSSFAPLSDANFTVGILEPKCKFLLHPLGISFLLCLEHYHQHFRSSLGYAAHPAHTKLAVGCAELQWDLSRKHIFQDCPIKIIDLLIITFSVVPHASGKRV